MVFALVESCVEISINFARNYCSNLGKINLIFNRIINLLKLGMKMRAFVKRVEASGFKVNTTIECLNLIFNQMV
jgi:hypothetical protein